MYCGERRLPVGAHRRPCGAVAGELRKLACAALSVLTSRPLRASHACMYFFTGFLSEVWRHAAGICAPGCKVSAAVWPCRLQRFGSSVHKPCETTCSVHCRLQCCPHKMLHGQVTGSAGGGTSCRASAAARQRQRDAPLQSMQGFIQGAHHHLVVALNLTNSLLRCL